MSKLKQRIQYYFLAKKLTKFYQANGFLVNAPSHYTIQWHNLYISEWVNEILYDIDYVISIYDDDDIISQRLATLKRQMQNIYNEV